MTTAHKFQHPSPPTWCIHCGEFDYQCRLVPHCAGYHGSYGGHFNCDDPEVYAEMFGLVFGTEGTR